MTSSNENRSETPAVERPVQEQVTFSLQELQQTNPGLADAFLWRENPSLPSDMPRWLHLGCGARVFPDFLNLDIAPQHRNVIKWNFLDLWPEDLFEYIEGAFTEDCLEHFYRNEQLYILCNLNRSLVTGATARVLMPAIDKLVRSAARFHPTPSSFLHFLDSNYGVETGADAINHMMRFTGHRWLHDEASLRRMAHACGFATTVTDCRNSTVSALANRNLRSEFDSVSFAADLRKTHHLSRRLIDPVTIRGAAKLEDLDLGAVLYVAQQVRPMVEYALAESVRTDDVACLNVRSSNTSDFDWNVKYLGFDADDPLDAWSMDETLKSQACMNILSPEQVRRAARGRSQISGFRFVPAYRPGQYFTVGPAEIYLRS